MLDRKIYMGVHERFYGMAMREVEQGIQREDLWVKAMVTSGGDKEKAKVLYLDLLAHLLAEDSADRKKKKVAEATVSLTVSAGRRIFYYSRLLFVWIILFSALSLGFEEAAKHYSKYFANNYEYGTNEEPKIYRNSSGHTANHPTRQQCYDSIVFQRTGAGYEKIPDILKEMMETDDFLFKQKYASFTDGSPIVFTNFGESVIWCSSNAASQYYNNITRRLYPGDAFEKWPAIFCIGIATFIFSLWYSAKILMKPLRQLEKGKEIQAIQ